MKRRGDVEDFDAEPLETLEPAIPFTVATESKATAQVAEQKETILRRIPTAVKIIGGNLLALCFVGALSYSNANVHDYNARQAEKARQEEADKPSAAALPRIPLGQYSPEFSGVVCGRLTEQNVVKGDVIAEIITQGLGDDPETQPIVEGDPEFAQEVYDRNLRFILDNITIEKSSQASQSVGKTSNSIKFFNDCIKISPVFTINNGDQDHPTYLRQATYQSYANVAGEPMLNLTFRSNPAGEFIPEATACQPHGSCEDFLAQQGTQISAAT